MTGLFGKKKSLKEYRQKKDWEEVARAYYDLGAAAMDRGDLNRAVLWLNRADTVYSASDEVYEQTKENRLFRKEIVSDCAERMGALENAPLLYNELPAEVDEKSAELTDPQLRIWGLLSMARLVRLGERLSKLPGCEVLGELGWAVDVIFKSIRQPVTQEEYGRLMDVCNGFYDFGDSEAFYGGGEIEVPGSEPFEVFDLNGMMGAPMELNDYIDNHLRLLSALSQNRRPPAAESSIVGCALLPDYYVRTGADNLAETPRVKAELSRIWSDYIFVLSRFTWEDVEKRISNYKNLDILRLAEVEQSCGGDRAVRL
ncbi:MAG: hypothetical protein K2O18_04560 [Oscillospiraceae bacterium]|nr:hypothetical protein [Oscillospiraceae bacterium]